MSAAPPASAVQDVPASSGSASLVDPPATGGSTSLVEPPTSSDSTSLVAGMGSPFRPPELTADEVEMMVEMQAINDQANKLVADNLDIFLRQNGSSATYEGWIGSLHPENVTLDARLLLPSSAHLRLWRERESIRPAPSESFGRPAPSDGFWKAVANLKAGTASLMPRANVSVGGEASSTEATAALAPEGQRPSREPQGVGPSDGRDLETFQEAKAEVVRLRALLLSGATGARTPTKLGRHAERDAPTRLDALLQLTGAPVPTVEDSFAALFERQERRCSTATGTSAVARVSSKPARAVHTPVGQRTLSASNPFDDFAPAPVLTAPPSHPPNPFDEDVSETIHSAAMARQATAPLGVPTNPFD